MHRKYFLCVNQGGKLGALFLFLFCIRIYTNIYMSFVVAVVVVVLFVFLPVHFYASS